MKITKIHQFSKKYLLYHVLYWFLNVLFFSVIFWSRDKNQSFLSAIHENAAFLPFALLFIYFSVNILIPKYFFSNKIKTYILLQLIIILLYPLVSNLIKAYYISPIIYHKKADYSFYNGALSIILIFIFGMVPLAGVKILNKIKKDTLLREKTEQDKVKTELKLRIAELKLLKSQIQPHFLFNTLNNLYSLSLEKSDLTPEMIIRLSDLLSYITYDCNSDKVPLEKELKFIENYIELQRIRYDKNLIINKSIKGQTCGLVIAPMILQTFVENGFKHGMGYNNEPQIDINLTINGNWLNFNMFNTKAIDLEGSTGGVGMENVKKRLQLLYPDKHILEIINNDSFFKISLDLELS